MSARAWIEPLPDGRTKYKFHQSWLGETDICLERSRRGLMGLLPADDTDANCAGTAVHAGAEAVLYAIKDDGQPLDLETMQKVAHLTFDELIEGPTFRWVKRMEGGARKFIDRSCVAWYKGVLPWLDPLAIELFAGPYVLYEDDKIVIELAGSIDYVDAVRGLTDWKTGGQEYKQWEKQRWAIQPTVYTWLLDQYCRANGLENPTIHDGFHRFTYYVMLGDSGGLQKVVVNRDPGDWAWLAAKARSIVTLIEAELPQWPLNDGHALCSAKWCPAWADCKGAHVAADWPRKVTQ